MSPLLRALVVTKLGHGVYDLPVCARIPQPQVAPTPTSGAHFSPHGWVTSSSAPGQQIHEVSANVTAQRPARLFKQAVSFIRLLITSDKCSSPSNIAKNGFLPGASAQLPSLLGSRFCLVLVPGLVTTSGVVGGASP